MIILGIDPGIAIVGYGVVEYKAPRFATLDYGAITTPAHTSVDSRLEIIYSSLTQLISMYSPTQMSVERLFFNTNTKTAIDVAQARGVILLAARQNGLDIGEYTPLQVKQAVTGYGQADKRQVMLMIKTILSLDTIPKPDDAADALAVAVCHAHSVRS